MSIEQEKMIVEALPSLYPLQKFEEDAVHAVIDALPHWIPVTERLPTEGESVLLGDDNKNMTLGRLIRTDDGYKWGVYAWWNDLDDWIAWMPLPELYKGVTE